MQTTASGLKKPDLTDNADLTIFVGQNMDRLETLLGNRVSSFVLPSGSGTTTWYKIAELVTAIGSGENGLILTTGGTSDFGNNLPGLDIMQVSTRGSVSLNVYSLLPAGSNNTTFGYTNNATSGKTEIWVQRTGYPYETLVSVLKNTGAITGNLASQTTAPSGIIYSTKKNIATLESPAFTGTPTAPTASTATNSTQIATTAYVKAQGYLSSVPTLDSVVSSGSSTTRDTTVGRIFQQGSGAPYSNLGNPTVAEMALFHQQYTNKTWFYDTTKIVCEYTNDGTTWVNANVSAATLADFVAGTNASNIAIPNACKQYRITITNNGYVFLNALYMYWSSNSHNTEVRIQKYNGNDATPTWADHTSSTSRVSAWPGHLYLPFSTIAFSQAAGQFNQVRILFTPTWSTDPTYGTYPINIYGMEIWGGYPSGSRHIYSWDSARNVTFPASLNATGGLKSNGSAVWTANNFTPTTKQDAITVSTTAPASPVANQLWIDTN